MSFNGSGTFQINSAGQPVVSGTVISSTAFNALTADLATGLSTCITKDGQTTVTANIPMGNNKITGLAVGTAATDAANLSQVQSTTAKLINSISGTDTITGTMSPTLGAYATGQMFYFIAAGDNTGAVTLNIDSLGAKAVTRDGSVALAASDLKSGEVVVVVYDGTRFQVVSQLNSAGDARFANVSIASALNVGGVATFTGGTANGVTYLNGSKVLTSGTALVFDGTNLGIGTTSPAAGLHVANGNFRLTNGSAFTTGNALIREINAAAGSSNQFVTSSIGFRTDAFVDSGIITFGTASSASTPTERMRLDASGRLQIGTTTQDGMLTVVAPASTGYGAFDAASSSFANLTFKTGGTTYAYIGSANAFVTSGTANDFAIRSQNALTFATGGGTERMRLDSSGNLSVGAVLAENSVGAYLLPSGEMRVKDSTEDGTSQISIYNTNTTADAEQFFAAMNSSDVDMGNRRSGALKLFTNNIERARIPAAGGVVVGTAALATNATDGFLYVPTCAGTPTGTPTTQTGTAPIVIDTTNNKLYFYSGGQWRDAGP